MSEEIQLDSSDLDLLEQDVLEHGAGIVEQSTWLTLIELCRQQDGELRLIRPKARAWNVALVELKAQREFLRSSDPDADSDRDDPTYDQGIAASIMTMERKLRDAEQELG